MVKADFTITLCHLHTVCLNHFKSSHVSVHCWSSAYTRITPNAAAVILVSFFQLFFFLFIHILYLDSKNITNMTYANIINNKSESSTGMSTFESRWEILDYCSKVGLIKCSQLHIQWILIVLWVCHCGYILYFYRGPGRVSGLGEKGHERGRVSFGDSKFGRNCKDDRIYIGLTTINRVLGQGF